MRRISFNRPKEKLRGTRRRLNALDQWADSLAGYFPAEYAKEPYWHWKIPILDRMVNPPTTTPALQAHCANALLRAAAHLEQSKPKEWSQAIVTVLITHPNMFGSELCVFFDLDYWAGFFKRNDTAQKVTPLSSGSLASDLSLSVPKGFEEVGFHHEVIEESGGAVSNYHEQWWSYRCLTGQP